MATYTELNRIGDWLRGETDDQRLRYSRESITILAGSGSERALKSGQVLGKIVTGSASSAAFAGNTGNGTMGTVTVSAGAKVGVYKLVVVEPATNAGKFTVEDPDGITIGVGTVAAAFSAGGLAFTLADGATDFVSGDGFNITVAAGSGKYVALDLSGADGRQIAAGILALDATAADGTDGAGVAIVRDAVVISDKLTWPAGATTDQKNAALAQLALLGIINRAAA